MCGQTTVGKASLLQSSCLREGTSLRDTGPTLAIDSVYFCLCHEPCCWQYMSTLGILLLFLHFTNLINLMDLERWGNLPIGRDDLLKEPQLEPGSPESQCLVSPIYCPAVFRAREKCKALAHLYNSWYLVDRVRSNAKVLLVIEGFTRVSVKCSCIKLCSF